MKKFTVIGYWSDTRQRYAKGVYAADGAEAERDVLNGSENDGGRLRVCAVISGWDAVLVDYPQKHLLTCSKHSGIGDRAGLVGKKEPK